MSDSDAFDAIISNGDFEELEQTSKDIVTVSIKSLHETVSNLNKSGMIIMNFIMDYFEAVAAADEVPAFSTEAAQAILAMSAAAESFCEEVSFYDDEEE